jgi:C1A family cysteine protease
MKCLKCGSELPRSGSHCASCGQKVFTRGAQPGEKSLSRRLDGALPEARSPNDFTATPNMTTLPRQVDLREHCTPVEDQGQLGSCVACAAVGAMEFRLKKEGKAVDLSRMFVYYNARRMSGHEGGDYGSAISRGMAAFLAFGAPPEATWPYQIDLVSKQPEDAIYTEALKYVPTEYARVDGLENIKATLARGYPVVFAGSIPEKFCEALRATGRAPAPSKAEVEAAISGSGNHAKLLVGYDMNAQEFLVRNSWGEGWGDKGYFWLPFETYTGMTENNTWILGKLEASGDFKIERPKVEEKKVEGGVKDLAAKLREDIRSNLTRDIKDSFKEVKDRMKQKP